jgi:hypothetical protein
MFGHETIIGIVFRILNFGVFLGFCLYVYKKYFSHSIETTINTNQMVMQGMVEQKIMLENRSHDLEQKLTDQQELCAQLQEKVLFWKSAQEKAYQKQQHYYEQLALQAKQRSEKVSDFINSYYTDKKAFEIALAKVNDSLRHDFQDGAGTEYLQQVVRAMQEAARG